MAQENDKNRKSQRNFNLEKPVKRSFDLEKEIPQEAASLHDKQPDQVPPMNLPEPPETGKPMKMTWIWIFSIIVLVVIVIACIRGCDSAERAGQPQQTGQLQAPAPDEEQKEDAAVRASDATEAETQAADSVAADVAAAAAAAESAATPYEPQQPSTASSASVSYSVSPSVDLEAEAARVIRGDYGNGDERRVRLGDNYRAVQNVVNRMLAQ